jgi:AICAR transformylase/IMP cyclohydrolase PurH
MFFDGFYEMLFYFVLLQQFELLESMDSFNRSTVAEIKHSSPSGVATVTLQSGRHIHPFQVLATSVFFTIITVWN